MKKSDYSFMFLLGLFVTTSAFAQDPMFAAPSAATTTPVTTTNPTSTLFSASPAATISPVTTTSPATTTTPSVSTSRAVEVSITGIGPPVDAAAFETVRQVIGHAVADGVLDKFVVSGHGVEGGFSACAEATTFGQIEDFDAFINQLRTIRPNPQTTAYSVIPAQSCTNDVVFCTQDAKQCADGSFVGRIAPSCEFAPCPGTR